MRRADERELASRSRVGQHDPRRRLDLAFLLTCPNCGPRDVHGFRFGGEVTERPSPDASGELWTGYFYLRANAAGPQREWWYHKFGCRRWFLAERDTVTNEITGTSWPEAGGPSS